MNYLELLKHRGKSLVIDGVEGSGKSLLADQLANDDVNVTIDAGELASHFTGWMKDVPAIVIVDADSCNDSELRKTLTRVKQLASFDKIKAERQGYAPMEVTTPLFIVLVDSEFVTMNNRHFTVINIGEVHE